MKITSAICGLTLAGFLSGCGPAVSLSPLYTDADLKTPVLDSRIEGKWIFPDLDHPDETDGYRQVEIDTPSPNGTYSLTLRPGQTEEEGRAEVTRYNFHLVTIDANLFFDAQVIDHTVREQTERPENLDGVVTGHLLGRLEVQKDLVVVELLDPDWMSKNTAESFRTERSGESLIMMAPTADLRGFFAQIAKNREALPDLAYLCRPETDCVSRAFETLVTRSPNDPDAQRGAAEFYSKRGNYDRAIGLLEHMAGQDPMDARWPELAGSDLLLKRDFAGARRAFAVAQQLGPDDFLVSEISKQIVWSYFLEGAYAEAIAAAAQFKGSGSDNSADPILLSYFSMLRLKRPDDARTFLSEKTSQFIGEQKEHILLLDGQSRITDDRGDVVSLPTNEQEWRHAVFEVLKELANGASESARSNLERMVFRAPQDSLLALAAKIELERLGPKVTK